MNHGGHERRGVVSPPVTPVGANKGEVFTRIPDAKRPICAFAYDSAEQRDAVGDPSGALVEPVVQAFCDELDGVSETRPDLADKCADLQRQLHGFAARLSAEPDCDDDSSG